jgi:archaetidylinositol phosphate synthase
MIEPYIRPSYQYILGDPLARMMGKVLSPDFITLLSVLTGVGISPALFFNQPMLALVLLMLSGLLDTLDGTVARLFHKNSPYGTALDIVCDRIVEFSIVFGLFLVSPEHAVMCFIMLGSMLVCITSFLVVGIFSKNESHKSFHYSPGLMERPEAFIFFGAMILFPGHFQSLAVLFSFLVFLTALLRMIEFKRAIQKNI